MQDRAVRTRRVILEAAAGAFETRGYLGTHLRDLVAEQDLSKGAVYFHFPTKKDLAMAVIQEQRDLWPNLVTDLRRDHPRAIRLLVELSWQAAEMFRHNVLVRASTRLAFERDQISPATPALFGDWAGIIEKLLIEAKEQDDVLPEVDTKCIAEFIVAAFAGCQRISEAETGRSDLRWRTTMMWRHLLPALVKSSCHAELGSVLCSAGGSRGT